MVHCNFSPLGRRYCRDVRNAHVSPTSKMKVKSCAGPVLTCYACLSLLTFAHWPYLVLLGLYCALLSLLTDLTGSYWELLVLTGPYSSPYWPSLVLTRPYWSLTGPYYVFLDAKHLYKSPCQSVYCVLCVVSVVKVIFIKYRER